MDLVAAVAAVVAFTMGMFAVRRRATGEGVPVPLLVASAVGAVAAIVGTTVRVSGVALAVPVVAIAAVVIARSRWRLGDTGILGLLIGLGTGAGYGLAAVLDPDTGSYGDQGAILLVLLGVLVSCAAVARYWFRAGGPARRRSARFWSRSARVGAGSAGG
ncbi:MAG: hypothetical protein ACRD0C_14025 [Acidimicrobiia bacterium]